MTYRILLGTELRPEIALIPEVEGRRETIVSLFKGDNLESSDVVNAVKLASGAGSERSASDPDFTHLLNDMSEDVLGEES